MGLVSEDCWLVDIMLALGWISSGFGLLPRIPK